MTKYTKEDLLQKLIDLAELLGRKPTKYDLKENNLPPANTFRRYGISLGGDWLKIHLHEKESPRCEECGELLSFEKANNKFCSHSCRAIYYNKLNYGSAEVAPKLECLHCGRRFKGKSDKTKYCSQDCMFKYQFIERFRDWYEFGRFFENEAIRKFLVVLHGYQCSECGISEWNGKEITLEVEHIDGNSENSSVDNVCFLCPNCHSQTPTYKARNMGNGRHYRRMRYQEGKSY